MLNANSATASDFDAVAQQSANAFWLWLIVTALVWWLFSMPWAMPTGILTFLCVVRSVGATHAAHALRTGKYRVLNPNNGAPDGDAANWKKIENTD